MEELITEGILEILECSIDDIDSVEINCGTMWVEVRGITYAISCIQCEE